MEAIKENISKKRRRGRPYCVFTDAEHKLEMMLLCENVSDRTVANRMHFSHALGVLGGGYEPEFLWLADARANRHRKTTLYELGKIDDDDLLYDVARQVCERKLKTAAAIRMIRARRGVLKAVS